MRYRARLKKFRFKRGGFRKNKNRIPKPPKQRSKYFWTIANNISISKIFLIPLFVIFYLRNSITGYSVCLVIVIFAEASDYFDGFIARRFNMVSDVGKLIDPMADSLFRFSMYLTFYTDRTIPVWVVFIFFFRDIIVAYVRMGLSTQGIVLAAKRSGKNKAIFQASGAIIILLLKLLLMNHLITETAMANIVLAVVIIVSAVVLYSLFDYLIPSIKVMRNRNRS
ncbi:CDP-alcohol phosphatidyltransferase family protein [candidate division KSB1 bacterium]|nr:CDP-alcohol phosphatidyltransferase family protein [candidate division KSB1 bacterium]